jgi:hypothetical protein
LIYANSKGTGGVFLTANDLHPVHVNSAGDLEVDYANENDGTFTHVLKFGYGTGEGISSKRTSGGNQYGLDFYTNFANRMSISNDGNVGINLNPINTGFNAAILQLKSDGDDNLRLVASDNVNDWSIFSYDGTNGSLELYKNGNFRGLF